MFDIGALLKSIRETGPKIYFGILVATGLLLFLPETMVKIGLSEIRQEYRTYLGIGFVGSASLLAAHMFGALGIFVRQTWRNWRNDRGLYQLLQASTAAEKQFLRRYIVDGQNIQAAFNDGVAQGLRAKRIVYSAVNVTNPGQPGFLMPWNLQPHARMVLEKNRALLE